MNFEEVKDNLTFLIDNNYENFIKALISIEKNIKNKEILDDLYSIYINNDDLYLLNDEFDFFIEELEEKNKSIKKLNLKDDEMMI